MFESTDTPSTPIPATKLQRRRQNHLEPRSPFYPFRECVYPVTAGGLLVHNASEHGSYTINFSDGTRCRGIMEKDHAVVQKSLLNEKEHATAKKILTIRLRANQRVGRLRAFVVTLSGMWPPGLIMMVVSATLQIETESIRLVVHTRFRTE